MNVIWEDPVLAFSHRHAVFPRSLTRGQLLMTRTPVLTASRRPSFTAPHTH